MPLSAEKSKVLALPSISKGKHNYGLNEVSLDFVQKVRDLGFIITHNLSFDDHISEITRKAARKTHNLFRALKTKDPLVLIKAYKTYIRPILEYGTSVYSPHKKILIRTLEKVQNDFTRKLMLRVHGFNYSRIPISSERNKFLGLRTLDLRRKRNDLILLFKILHGLVRIDKGKLFSFQVSATRGDCLKIVLTRPRSNLRFYFFCHRAASEYNKISKRLNIPNSIDYLRE